MSYSLLPGGDGEAVVITNRVGKVCDQVFEALDADRREHFFSFGIRLGKVSQWRSPALFRSQISLVIGGGEEPIDFFRD